MRAEDWDTFDFSYSLDMRRLIPHIVAVEQYQAAARSAVLPPHWLEVPDALAAAAPDDAPVHEDEPACGPTAVPSPFLSVAQQTGDDPAAAPRRSPIRYTPKARAWIKQRFVPGSAPLSLPDILALHRMVAEEHGVDGPTAGAFRTTPIQVGRPLVGGLHQGAPVPELPRLMDRYVEFIDGAALRSLPAVIHALLAHFFLDTIHPFKDGNGRMSRLVTAAILSWRGYNLHGTYALVRYFYRHDVHYHTLLHRIWKSRPFELTPFVAFGMEGFVLELKSVDSFIKMKLNRIADRDVSMPAFAGRIGARRRGLN